MVTVRNVLVLSSDEDRALAWARESCGRYTGQRISLVWPYDRLRKVLAETDGFDGLIITPDVLEDPRARTWITTCQLRVRGADGLLLSERIAASHEIPDSGGAV